MKLYIFTEGSIDIGFGHITRCIALYRQFEQKGWSPKLIIRGDQTILSLVTNVNHSFADWLNPTVLEQYLSKKIDIAIIDSYLADKIVYEKISRSANLTVYLDDNNRFDYPKGIVVNGNIYASLLPYKKKNCQEYLLGTFFTLLRNEFVNVLEKVIQKNIHNILIMFGGDDNHNMTPKVLNMLNKQYPKLKKVVIIGAGFQHAQELLCDQDKNILCVSNPSASHIKELMINADIAISGGGQTLYELARTGTPTIGVVVADNQTNNVRELAKQGIIMNVGEWNDETIIENIMRSIPLVSSLGKRTTMSRLGQKCVDGNGAYRAASKIVSYYIKNNLHMRKAVLSDEKQILDLSNDTTIRMSSFQTKPITENEHSKWFKEKLSDKYCLYVVAVLKEIIVGQLRFDIKNTEATISMSVHPQYQGYSIGSKLFEKGVETLRREYAFIQTIVALIKKENQASQLFFKKIGFSQKK